MQFSFTYPIVGPYDRGLLTKGGVRRVAEAGERAGFHAIAFTDHPIPSHRWLEAGGHDAFDPFAVLSFVAAATDRIGLMTNIAVVPYRNPFLLAKSVATLDALSEGRAIVGTGTGYQKAEFKALGVDFDERNELFDEALEVLIGIWTSDDFAYEGRNFTALGNTANPKPPQDPHPPIWIGGNSRKARERVAKYGQGWSPFPAPRVLAKTSRTPPLETLDDLVPLLDDLNRQMEAAGRGDDLVDVHFICPDGGSPASDDFDVDAHLQGLMDLTAVGVSWVGVGLPGDSIEHAIEVAERYGETVIKEFN